ncbi:MAG: ATP-binding protein [Terriglobales bacterium]
MPRKILILSAVIVTLHVIQEVLVGPTPAGSFLANTLQIFTACVAAMLCFAASRRGVGFTRPFWLLIGCSFLVWAIANSGWVYYESFLHVEPPTDSIFPFLVESRSLFLAMALLLDQKEESESLGLASFFDFVQLLIIFALIYLGWYYLPIMHEDHHNALVRAAEMEIGEDLVVLGLAFVQAQRAHTKPMRSLYLGLASYLAILTLGVFITDYELLITEVPTGTWLDLLSTIPYLAAAWWAAGWKPTVNFYPASPREKGLASLLLNNTIFALAPLIVLLQAAELGSGWRWLSFSLLGVSIVCFAVRLALSEVREVRSSLNASKADQERLEAESKFRIAFHANPESISITVLEDGTYLEVNNAFVTTMGYERSELIGKSSIELGLWVNKEDRIRLVEKLRRGERISATSIKARTKSGQEREMLLSADPVQVQGQPCILFIMRDVTEQRLLEQQTQQAQRMEAIGRLAGGVAHDFNNILMIASANVQLLEESRDDPAKIERYAHQIQNATDRGASLTRQLLAFGRRQMLNPSVLDLNAVVTELWKMLPRLLGEDIDAVLSLDSTLGQVSADRGQLEQVIMNLAVNARDAMPQGGRLTVETTNAVIDDSFIRVQGTDIPPGRYVVLAVSDTGIGMSPEVQAQVFDPFFTTKELGKGTGLGLATVYGIVKQSGGYIWVSSEVGSGSTFKVYLPSVEAKAPVQEPILAKEHAPAGSGTILLVEDEVALREVTSEYLRSKGYEVVDAGDGDAAMQLCKSHHGPIDLLITDVVMPGSSGPTVAKAVLEARPGLRTIFMSGYTDRTLGPELLGPNAAFLQKPVSLDTLARKVHSMLNGKN